MHVHPSPSSLPDLIDLNVGGTPVTAYRDQLLAQPDSRLAQWISGDVPAPRDAQGRVFIDRDVKAFRPVLEHLRTGKFPPLSTNSLVQLEADCAYLGLEALRVDAGIETRRAYHVMFPEEWLGRAKLIDALVEAERYGEALDMLLAAYLNEKEDEFGDSERCRKRADTLGDVPSLCLAALTNMDDPSSVDKWVTQATTQSPKHPLVAFCTAMLRVHQLECERDSDDSDDELESTEPADRQALVEARLANQEEIAVNMSDACKRLDSAAGWSALGRCLLKLQPNRDILAALREGTLESERLSLGRSGVTALDEGLRAVLLSLKRFPAQCYEAAKFYIIESGEVMSSEALDILQMHQPSLAQALGNSHPRHDSRTSEAYELLATWTRQRAEANNVASQHGEAAVAIV